MQLQLGPEAGQDLERGVANSKYYCEPDPWERVKACISANGHATHDILRGLDVLIMRKRKIIEEQSADGAAWWDYLRFSNHRSPVLGVIFSQS